MTGWVRSQSMIVGRSIRPRTSRGTSGGTALTNTNRPGPARVGLGHPALILVRRADLEGNLRIGAQNLLEEEVAGTHQEDGDLARRRQDRVRDVVDLEVVVDADPRQRRPR